MQGSITAKAYKDGYKATRCHSEIGTIEEGKIADLVLLDADPLKDFSSTQKIIVVVISGKCLPKAEL